MLDYSESKIRIRTVELGLEPVEQHCHSKFHFCPEASVTQANPFGQGGGRAQGRNPLSSSRSEGTAQPHTAVTVFHTPVPPGDTSAVGGLTERSTCLPGDAVVPLLQPGDRLAWGRPGWLGGSHASSACPE